MSTTNDEKDADDCAMPEMDMSCLDCTKCMEDYVEEELVKEAEAEFSMVIPYVIAAIVVLVGVHIVMSH